MKHVMLDQYDEARHADVTPLQSSGNSAKVPDKFSDNIGHPSEVVRRVDVHVVIFYSG